MTTFPPSPAQGETAGVSEQRIRRLIDDLQSQVDDLVRNGETHTGARYRDTAAALRELLADRQQLAEMRGAVADAEPHIDLLLHVDNFLIENNLLSYSGDLKQVIVYLRALAPPAPTSQPSRGKCETCGGRQSILQPISKTARNPAKPDELVRVQMFVPCPDCAQPERQGARQLTYRERELAEVAFFASLKNVPSPPQDDIVAGLRRLHDDMRANGMLMAMPIIKQAIAALEGDKGWQPIATAPKDGRDILLCNLNWLPFMGRYVTAGDSGWFVDARGGQRNPTHWQSMPSPPIGAS